MGCEMIAYQYQKVQKGSVLLAAVTEAILWC